MGPLGPKEGRMAASSSGYVSLIDANQHLVAAAKILAGVESHTFDADAYRHVDQFSANLESLTDLFLDKFHDVSS